MNDKVLAWLLSGHLIGVFVWLGLYLRENRLKGLLPLRTR